MTKDLTKTLTLRIGGQSEKEIIIVMKAPNNRLSYNLTSFINIRMANIRRSNSMQIENNNENIEVEKRLKKRGSEMGDIDIETVINEKI